MNPNVGWAVTWQGIAGPVMPYLSTIFCVCHSEF